MQLISHCPTRRKPGQKRTICPTACTPGLLPSCSKFCKMKININVYFSPNFIFKSCFGPLVQKWSSRNISEKSQRLTWKMIYVSSTCTLGPTRLISRTSATCSICTRQQTLSLHHKVNILVAAAIIIKYYPWTLWILISIIVSIIEYVCEL